MLDKIRQLFRRKNSTGTEEKTAASGAATGEDKSRAKQEQAANFMEDSGRIDAESGNGLPERKRKGPVKRAMRALRRIPAQAAAGCLGLAAVVCMSLGVAGAVADASQASGYNSSQYFYLEYKPNGGSGSMSTDTVYAGSTYTLKTNTFTRTGYYFTGWSGYFHGKYFYYDSTSSSQTTYNGFYSEDTIPSGYKMSMNQKTIYYGSLPIVRGEETVTQGSTMWAVANWSAETYNLTFHPSGGTISSSTSNYTATVKYGNTSMTYGGSTHTTAPVPTRTGYTFQGWYTSTDYKMQVFTSTGAKNTSITTYWNSSKKWCKDVGDDGATLNLYAKWSPNTTTVYLKYIKDSNDSSGTYTTFQTYIMTYASNTFVLSTDQGTTRTDVSTSTGKVDISKAGYDFAGWYTAKTGGTQVFTASGAKNNTSATSYWSSYKWNYASSTLTLYAHWTPHTYTVVYDANGGTGTVTSQTCSYGTSYNFRSNSFRRSGYSFLGWYITNEDGEYLYQNSTGTQTAYYEEGSQKSGWTKVIYAAGSSFSNLTTTDGATITAYAAWRNSNAGWDNTNIIEDTEMFKSDTSLIGGDGTTYQKYLWDSTWANIDDADTNPGYFSEK